MWRKISTREDPEWTRRYHADDPAQKAFGARAEVTLNSGEVIIDELAVADAHPLGARPFECKHYVAKFTELAEGVISQQQQQRFLSVVEGLSRLSVGGLGTLNLVADPCVLDTAPTIPPGIF